ncbi:LysR family transcriptional regulator [Gorillibacterium massiliense]|uniref:LysR family transcriptional regulator n=1 Tax=Gorillibacterium massiliense TaxID=1280390 RepID=UPI0004BA6D4B|nr:LysR family transcriptional regulator [Gorillibacterium massiliense]
MDIRQLTYFLAIAEEGQITAAAKRLQMAQPPLSQQLRLLEEELGVKLVEREARNVRLTGAGELLRDRAQQIISLTESAMREIEDYAKGLTGTLSIGTVSSSGAALLEEKLADFHRAYAGVKFELHEGNTFAVLDMLRKGIVEVGIVRTPFPSAPFECLYMEPEPMVAVMTPELAWEDGTSPIRINELAQRPLILYRRFEAMIREACGLVGFEPEIFCLNDDARTTLHWAKAGLGIGLVPESALRIAGSGNLITREIASDVLKTRIAAIWMKDKYLSAPAGKFLEYFGKLPADKPGTGQNR